MLFVHPCSNAHAVIAFLIGRDVTENGTAGMDMMNLSVYHIDAKIYTNVSHQ